MYRYENTGSVYRRPKIPRQGSSPDFDHRCFSLPGFPVGSEAVPLHSDGIVPDSHRILFCTSDWMQPYHYNICTYFLLPGYLIFTTNS